ncbi:hypothetical protein KIL84_017753 [Mauremys mutica]|uniref:Uncharacterized protein n=1 Tax=Mauremys mutica TaxID=74926 RepID=A0A9D3X4X3_9SAUR|nr:hypothetical protein KIL84_017753 [Mauremys mutica]
MYTQPRRCTQIPIIQYDVCKYIHTIWHAAKVCVCILYNLCMCTLTHHLQAGNLQAHPSNTQAGGQCSAASRPNGSGCLHCSSYGEAVAGRESPLPVSVYQPALTHSSLLCCFST